MRCSTSPLALAGLVALARAATHELIVGTFGSEFLYTIEFDDEALTLQMVANTSMPVSSSWIAFSHDKKHLYGNSFNDDVPQFVGYTVDNATSITFDKSVVAGGNCTGKPIYVVADISSPYAVYGAFFGDEAGCGAVMSVDDSGALDASVQNITYFNTSGVHGSAISPDSTFYFSADDGGNSIWTHSIDSTTGELTYVANLTAPTDAADPRHVAVHPNGQYLYAVLEGSSQLAQYTVDTSTGILSYDSVYPLKKSNESASNFWADEVALSSSGSYLWATNRANGDDNNGLGYISAFELDETGNIVKQNFLLSTTSSGGAANSVAPSSFSDKFVALTDADTGFVQIWQLADDGSSASVVAQVNLEDGGCCANAVWYS
ncbi:hypothetical protein F5Y15DRAFT_56086 [Xylariaceae sp. FL0016]|nr:hypothetical protein F5Y15DRAFT_56086 [Xylariaceae sp. FL0016]